MRKGDLYADIFDSPETIAQAQREGYHLCSDAEKTVRDEDQERHRRGRKPKGEEPQEVTPPQEPEQPAPEAAEQPEKPKRHGVFG
jgi:hypothetical protein